MRRPPLQRWAEAASVDRWSCGWMLRPEPPSVMVRGRSGDQNDVAAGVESQTRCSMITTNFGRPNNVSGL
jgi:hypothetical protein